MIVMAATTVAMALTSAELGDVKLTGWIGNKANNLIYERVTSDWARNVMMRECEETFAHMLDDANSGVPTNTPTHKSGLWQGEFWGKTETGFALVAEYLHSEPLRKFVRESAHRVLKYQAPDGYLGTYRNRLHLLSGDNWNVWGRSFTADGLFDAARVTGDRTLLEAGARSLVQLIDMLHENHISINATGGCAGAPSCTILVPVLRYYEATGNVKFLDFAKEIVTAWDREEDVPPNYFRHAASGISPANWYLGTRHHHWHWTKSNEMCRCMQGLIEFARITENPRALEVAEQMFDCIRDHERNAILSVGYNDGFMEASSIPTAVTEGCDTLMWMLYLKRLYLATGKAKYADELELVYLNPFLASMTRDGRWGNRGVRSHCRHGAAGRLQAGMKHSHCCVNNLPRGFMEFATAELARSADGTHYVAFYTDAEARLGDVSVKVEGDWPVRDIAKVAVTAPAETKFRFRRPAWSATMKVNGTVVKDKDGWWDVTVPAGGAEYELAFDLSPRIVPLQARPDFARASNVQQVVNRWMIYDPLDIMPYYHMRDLPRVMRGPLLLAKSTRVGASAEAVFGWGALVFPEKDTCRLEPLDRQDAWGAWKLSFFMGKATRPYLTVNVCDFQSAGDFHDVCPTKTFSIFY